MEAAATTHDDSVARLPATSSDATLRRLTLADVDALFDLLSDEAVMRHVNIAPITERVGVLKYIATAMSLEERGIGCAHGVDVAGKLVGLFVTRHVSPHEVALGAFLATNVQRRGYGSAIATALIERVLSTPGVYRFSAQTDVANVAVKGALEKLGFKLEGRLRRVWPNFAGGAPRDVYQWALTK